MSKKLASELVAIGQKRSKLWQTPEGVAYADIILGGNLIACRVDSNQFSGWLKRIYYLETGSGCGKGALSSATSTLSTIAKMNGSKRPIFNRVGKADDFYYLDLGHPCGSSVKYSATGWEIIEYAPVHFDRSLNYLPLPFPSVMNSGSDENLTYFYKMIGATKKSRSNLTNFLSKCFVPSDKEPVLSIQGECGRSSSLAAEALKRLIDPFAINQLHNILPRQKLSAYAEISRVLLYEFFDCNDISSDEIDRVIEVSRGEGFASGISRPQILLYTESKYFKIQSEDIEIQSVNGGLLESEFDYWTDFSIVHPEVLGALLDVVCDRLAAAAI
jgi:hypothetical protein